MMAMPKFRGSILATLACIPCACQGQTIGNYTFTSTTTYSFEDISQTGASVLSGSDDGTAPLSIPFVFQFYGQPYTMVCVSTNGVLYFITDASSCGAPQEQGSVASGIDDDQQLGGGAIVDFVNTDLTATSTPNNLPAALPFWMDLTFQKPGGGAVYYQTVGTAGSRRFVVQWNNAYPLDSGNPSPNPVTFELLLSEGTNRLLMQYETTTLGAANPATNGGRATIGLAAGVTSNSDARSAWKDDSTTSRRPVQYSTSAQVVTNHTAILYSPIVSTTCALDVSSQVTVKRGGFTYDSSTQIFLQTVTITNSSNTTITPPLYLVLKSLSSNANLANASGTTNCTSQGNSYLVVPTTGSLAAGQSVSIQLQFADPTKGSITYSTQMLSGSGSP
jgi:hypothetical protein